MNDFDLDVARPAEDLGDGWRRCPTCGFQFKPSDSRVFKRRRHSRCGQRIDLKAASPDNPSRDYPLRDPSARAQWTPKPYFIGTVGVRGSHVAWPHMCTCCGRGATTFNEVTRTFKDSDLHAPVERIVKVTTTARIPVCHSCLSHIRASGVFTLGLMFGWIGTVAATIALFFILTQFRSGLAALFGLPASRSAIVSIPLLILFMIGAMTVVGRITWKYLNRARRLMNSDCTHPDGGVKFTGFVTPTEISPTLIETRRFTFRDQQIFESFVMANADKAFQAEDADDWNMP